jgi:hypothetical protein
LFLQARNRPDAKLSRDGPKIPDQFNMSGFSISAFCQANWPVVVDHVLPSGGELLIVVQAEGVPAFNYRVLATGRRQQQIFRLPAYFPARPTPGAYTITASTGGAGIATPVSMRLFGLGAGERAVGSVAIDQVRFGPDTIHPKQKQEALYAFHAHTDFDRVRAEFNPIKATLGREELILANPSPSGSSLLSHQGGKNEVVEVFFQNGVLSDATQKLLRAQAWAQSRQPHNISYTTLDTTAATGPRAEPL